MKTQRIRRLQQEMARREMDAAVLMQPRDLYYYSGTAQPCNLIIPRQGDPVLLVRRGESFVARETWLAYERGGGPRHVLQHLKRMGVTRGALGLEFDTVLYGLMNRMISALDAFACVDVSPLLLAQRMVKDAEERELIREATRRFDQSHETILKSLRPGMREVDLSACMADTYIRSRSEQMIFIRRWDDWLVPFGTIAGGENLTRISGHAHTVTGVGLGPALPWGPSERVLQEGDLVVVDNPCNYQGYHSDNTRTYVLGRATPRQKELYDSVRALQDAVLERIRPGVTAREAYDFAAHRASHMGYGDYFQGYGDSQGKYVGHGIGLEIDEPPVLDPVTDTPLVPGMVLAVECKFIIPGEGAVMLEDTLAVTETGFEIFSSADRGLAEVPCS